MRPSRIPQERIAAALEAIAFLLALKLAVEVGQALWTFCR